MDRDFRSILNSWRNLSAGEIKAIIKGSKKLTRSLDQLVLLTERIIAEEKSDNFASFKMEDQTEEK